VREVQSVAQMPFERVWPADVIGEG
jgi:hypothetical protein